MSLFPVALVQRDGWEMLPRRPVNRGPVIPDVVECLFLLFIGFLLLFTDILVVSRFGLL